MIDHPDDPDWLRITRHLAASATGAEARVLDAWVSADRDRQQMVEELRVACDDARTLPTLPVAWDTDTRWHELRGRIQRDRRPMLRRIVWAAAAAIVAVAGGTLIAERILRREAGSMQEVATNRAQRATVRLADGTQVTLDVGSRLRHATGYGRTDRNVFLEGRAYFDVRHDPKRPFLVHAKGIDTEDLGTAFTIRAYADELGSEIVVASGRVSVRDGAARVEAGAGERVLVARGAPPRVERVENVTPYVEWMHGRLVFTNARFDQVVIELSRTFDLDIAPLDSAVAAKRLTASVEGESIDRVLDLIALTLDLRYDRAGTRVRFFTPPPR